MKHYKHLIFIVAYNAEKHICSVLDRIPNSLHNSESTDILIIDDASKDKTSERAAE
jgi:glycosyltransferase involved in cell wall biosynthesis